jgi:predicted DNA-binding protein (UPF0251 family)/predicted Fe-Mo cluster-binding NifX family protein
VPRPRKNRLISISPKVTHFKPRGVPMRELTETYLPLEGLEALRLADLERLSQAEAAERMNVSRHTFGRIVAEARRVVADALINGLALRVQGGDYEIIAGEQPCEPADRRDPCLECFGGGYPSLETKERIMSKVAVTSEGPALNDLVDPRFGRAAGFVIVETETMEAEYVDNGESQVLAHGAGIQAAQAIANAGASVLLTGYVGPKAFHVLSAAGIKVVQNLDNMTVAEAVERYKSGEVEYAGGPNREGRAR